MWRKVVFVLLLFFSISNIDLCYCESNDLVIPDIEYFQDLKYKNLKPKVIKDKIQKVKEEVKQLKIINGEFSGKITKL